MYIEETDGNRYALSPGGVALVGDLGGFRHGIMVSGPDSTKNSVVRRARCEFVVEDSTVHEIDQSFHGHPLCYVRMLCRGLNGHQEDSADQNEQGSEQGYCTRFLAEEPETKEIAGEYSAVTQNGIRDG